MTCAQGLLRLLWGGPKLECYGTDEKEGAIEQTSLSKSSHVFAFYNPSLIISKLFVLKSFFEITLKF